MTLPEEILEILGKVSDDHGFAHLSVNIELVLTNLNTPDDVQDLLQRSEWASAVGWIARQSGVIIRPDADDTSLGAVLEAELGNAAASLQVRRLEGRWVATRIEETLAGDMLADDVVLVTTHGKAARYRRYWKLPESGAAEIVACRLVGFEEMD